MKIITPLPIQIEKGGSDLGIWLDPSDPNTLTDSGGGSLSNQADKSGSGNHLTQSTGADRPTTGANTINGLNAINYDGSQYLENNAFASEIAGEDTPFSVHLVYQATETGTPAYTVFGVGNTTNTSNFLVFMNEAADTNTPSFRGRGTINPFTSVNFGSADTDPHVISIIRKATTLTVYIDGFKIVDNVAFDISALTINTFTLGCLLRTTGQELNFKGNLGEFIFYTRENTESEIAAIHNYLGSKWL